jgi:hypothetical protein
MDLQKRYKNYNIDDKIEEIIDKLVEDELNLKKINKKYKKPVKKMEIEDDPLDYCKCMARRLNGGYGGQCTWKKINGTKYCRRHQTEEQRWCGIMTEKRQEKFYLVNDKGRHLHKWKN